MTKIGGVVASSTETDVEHLFAQLVAVGVKLAQLAINTRGSMWATRYENKSNDSSEAWAVQRQRQERQVQTLEVEFFRLDSKLRRAIQLRDGFAPKSRLGRAYNGYYPIHFLTYIEQLAEYIVEHPTQLPGGSADRKSGPRAGQSAEGSLT